ncbi:MAG: nucleotidyltransferase domain-containing protein [Nanoarchaeota archaeon]|nr:nucleotidyltransferase domain-containing protein [Nanoarchaeota archaeon]
MNVYEHRILELFFKRPMSKFHIRELGRLANLDTKTVMKYLRDFIKRKLIVRKKEKIGFPFYEANRLSPLYRYEKSHVMIEKIYESNLIIFLEKELNPKVIVLFGSIQKGTYHEKSDIDIFIQAKYRGLYLSKFERILKHKIKLFFEEDPKSLTKGLLQNIYNGFVLSGQLEP